MDRGQQFVDEMYPSVEGTISPDAQESQMDWNQQSMYPEAYLKEATHPDEGFEHRDSIHRNLHRMGFVDDNGMVTVRRVGQPRVGLTNVSILPGWGESSGSKQIYGQQSASLGDNNTYEWKIPVHHVVGLGHDTEGELWVIHHPGTKTKIVRKNNG